MEEKQTNVVKIILIMECSILRAKKVPYVTMSVIVYVIVITILLLSLNTDLQL
jgi:hypothetical protein